MRLIASLIAPSLLPYVVGAVAAVVLSLAAVIGWQTYVTIPLLRAQVAERDGKIAKAEALRDQLEKAIASQNAEVERLAERCRRSSAAASRAGIEASIPKPFVRAETAEQLNDWLLGVAR